MIERSYTDRELTKEIAKFLGFELMNNWLNKAREEEVPQPTGLCLKDNHTNWDPLNEDAHAFEVAVRLQLFVYNEHLSAGGVYCGRQINQGNRFIPVQYFEYVKVLDGPDNKITRDDFAATRRAIFLAAAEIALGKRPLRKTHEQLPQTVIDAIKDMP